MSIWRPTVAEIDLAAIRENCRALGAGGGGALRLAVVKANAYGHGDVEVARACLEAGTDWLAVALVEEGVRLREAGIDAPILVLIEASGEAAKEIVSQKLTPSIFTKGGAESISAAAVAAGVGHPVQVCVDTGMHREGAPLRDALELLLHAASLPGLEVQGIWSHLAVADERDHPATGQQAERFVEICDAAAAKGLEVPLRHLANSVGTMAMPEIHLDLVRMGIATYGLYPADWLREHCALRPALRWVSQVGMVRRVPGGEGISYGLTYAPERESTIATVLVGYADGYTRLWSNRAHVLVGGERRRVAGRVTMDQIMVDCGGSEVSVGDEAVLIGRQGAEEITADELASLHGTINYEVVTTIGSRVPRVYIR